MDLDSLATLTLLTGSLGAASMGLVETAKRVNPWFASVGRRRLLEVMGNDAVVALQGAYGIGVGTVLDAAFRQSDEELSRVLRNGVKVGFATCTDDDKRKVAAAFGQEASRLVAALRVDPERPVADAAEDAALRDARHALGQFEMAVDMRVDAAVASSSDVYAGWMQLTSGVVAIVLALAGALATAPEVATAEDQAAWNRYLVKALMIGLAAVPVAPLANDLAGALKSAAAAVRGRAA